jgi:hypothetical protein
LTESIHFSINGATAILLGLGRFFIFAIEEKKRGEERKEEKRREILHSTST